jgi:hypothetical protein
MKCLWRIYGGSMSEDRGPKTGLAGEGEGRQAQADY